MTTVVYSVPAISCGHCTHTIETEVGEVEGCPIRESRDRHEESGNHFRCACKRG